MKLIKIAFVLDHRLQKYRLSFFRMLSNSADFELSVFHSGKPLEVSIGFKEFIVDEKIIFGFQFKNIPSLKDYDVVICMQNIRMLNLWSITFRPFRKYRIIHWGIGVSSAHGLSDKKTLVSKARNFLSNFSDAIVLYSDFPKPLFSRKNWRKTFVAHNTVENQLSQNLSDAQKNCFLFIGTLNKRKGLDMLILAFKTYLEKHSIKRIDRLVIVGDGPEKESLQKLVSKLGIQNKVDFAGRLTEPQDKLEYFRQALVSISPMQAGLSVLESFSFGVPFIAHKNAISGGEHLNIKNNVNGFLIESENELVETLMRLDNDIRLAQKLGDSAYEHYSTKRSMEKMVDSFVEAIHSSLAE